MKTQNFTMIFVIMIMTVLTLTSFLLPAESETGNVIDLEGMIIPEGIRSGGVPISAEKQDTVISATFHAQLGEVLITLTDVTDNQVYSVAINTSVHRQIIIPISGLPSGVYIITFSNERGMMYGYFEK